ncbi:hypothetical protein FS749_010964 [Ceratobasidium sp. UAMH 11750]|nr:hypothetical protein FS749_010964 [Ceratobasidium sp. UAMH 11750]
MASNSGVFSVPLSRSNLSNEEICKAHNTRSWSDVYDHYGVSLIRDMRPSTTGGGEAFDYMEFALTCKLDSSRHLV